MAFSNANLTSLFTILGQYVISVNLIDDLATTDIDTYRSDLRTVLDSQGYLEYYKDIPNNTDAYKDTIAGWIATIIANSKNIFTDRDKIYEELPLTTFDFDSAFDAVFDFMVNATPAQSIEHANLSFDGTAYNNTVDLSANGATASSATIFLSSLLDGVSSPASGIVPNIRYTNLSSTFAKDTDVTFECTTANTPGTELLTLFPTNKEEGFYSKHAANPGVSALTNVENTSLTGSNYDFSKWSSDDPTGWVMSGGVSGTAWEDVSSTGEGPLRLNTSGVAAKRKITGLSNNRCYFVGARCLSNGSSGSNNLKIELVDSTNTAVVSGSTNTITPAVGATLSYAHFFVSIPSDYDLTDVYMRISSTLGAAGTASVDITKTMITPAIYYNGAATVFWEAQSTEERTGYTSTPVIAKDFYGVGTYLNSTTNGLFDKYLARAFGKKLPSAVSPTISDALAVRI